MLQKLCTMTKFIIHINDIKRVESIDEFLLQFHEGLQQGSKTGGMAVSMASAIAVSSNDSETTRLQGRVLTLEYKKDQSFPNNTAAIMAFKEVAQQYSGFPTAWVLQFGNRWEAIEEECCIEISKILKAIILDKHQRWYDQLASVLYTQIMEVKTEVMQLADNAFSVAVMFLKEKEECTRENFRNKESNHLQKAHKVPLSTFSPAIGSGLNMQWMMENSLHPVRAITMNQ
eukprot:gene16488-18128_t